MVSVNCILLPVNGSNISYDTSSVWTLYTPVFASMEILTIGVVRYLTQTALLDMMAIDSPTTIEGMKQTTPLRSSIIMFLMMSSLRLFITACRILMFRINHLAFHWIDRPPVYLGRDCVSTVSQAYSKVTVIPKS